MRRTRSGRGRRTPALVLAFALGVAGCASDDGADAADPTSPTATETTTTVADDAVDPTATTQPFVPEAYGGHRSEQYDDLSNWLCTGALDDDVCDTADLDTTLVFADGTTEIVAHRPAESPVIDCFYVYPTISEDPTSISDLDPGSEIAATRNQAAFLNSTCEVYAPIYRQFTLAFLARSASDEPPADAGELVYGDVLAAFRTYVVEHGEDRPFVLLGHSQGAGHLRRLIAEEIDDESVLRDRLVAAYLLGTSVPVAVGSDVGGAFANVPLCRADDQIGCIVSYASYRADDDPGPGSLFGSSSAPDTEAACTNPAALADGGDAILSPSFRADATTAFTDGGAEITTPFVGFPDFVRAECRRGNGRSWLAVSVDADPSDPRVDDIPGDLPLPGWGLHVVDLDVARGDIGRLVAAQAAAATGS